jgi:glycosyltransferase involved in cell wall biosynthesis
MNMISVTILTRDSAPHLRRALEAVRAFPEVIVLDSGSTDNTLEIARQFPNVRAVSTQFKGFGPLHIEATALASHDWILSVDSDEVVTEALAEEIARLALDSRTVYWIPRKNYYNGRWIRGCGWYPDRHVRLYNRTVTRFSDLQVHEAVLTDGLREVELQGALEHYSYACLADFLSKMQRYSDLFAKDNAGRKRSSLGLAIIHGLGAFLKSYLFQRGFLDGAEGFIISAYNGQVALYKYLKLREANQRRQ